MSASGRIPVDFNSLRSNYPVFNKLPPHLQSYIDALNKAVKPGGAKNTPCCLQMSQALNGAGADHKVPTKSHRRPNPELPHKSGNYFIQAVDELVNYLTDKYGAGESVKVDKRTTADGVKKALAGRQGILCFGDATWRHTELWDKTRIIQDGAPSSNGAAMSQKWLFDLPRIFFWETTTASAAQAARVPPWLTGWWEVKDGAQLYFYYFYPNGVVHYTRTRPAPRFCPITSTDYSGAFAVDQLQKVTIKWNVGEYWREVYAPANSAQPTAMTGSYEGHPGVVFRAAKL